MVCRANNLPCESLKFLKKKRKVNIKKEKNRVIYKLSDSLRGSLEILKKEIARRKAKYFYIFLQIQ